MGGDFVRYEGNSESFFLLNLGLFVLGGVVAIGSWSAIDPDALVGTTVRFDRFLAGFLLASALFLIVGLHIPHLLTIWIGSPTDEYLADPGVFWLVKLMDLGIIVPAMVGVAIGLLPSCAQSMFRTSCPGSRRSRTTHLPAFPLPPVTTIFIACSVQDWS